MQHSTEKTLVDYIQKSSHLKKKPVLKQENQFLSNLKGLMMK